MNATSLSVIFVFSALYVSPAFSACSGDQIAKMVDAGFTKPEIKDLCGGGEGEEPNKKNGGMTTTCGYSMGPKSGQVQYFHPNTPGLRPVMVGQSCTDGKGSWGTAIPDR